MTPAAVTQPEALPEASGPDAVRLAASVLGAHVAVRVVAAPADVRVLADLLAPLLHPSPPPHSGDARVLGVERRDDGWGLVDGRVTEVFETAGDVAEAALALVNRHVIDVAQRRYTLLHGAGLVVGGRTVLLVGPSGSGKSTLAAGLVGAGADYLGDEAAALGPGDLALHGYPKPLGLKAGSLEVARAAGVGSGQPDHRLVDPSRLGVRVPRLAAPPSLVVLPDYASGVEGLARTLPPAEAVLTLARSTFGFAAHGERDLPVLARLVRRAPVVALRYDGLGWAVAAVRDVADGARPVT